MRSFITKHSTSIKVIFATYQSAAIVSEGLRGLPLLDIAVFDEAHKTTGPRGGLFAHCLSDENIRIRKRLFLTATPRHYDIRHRDREGDLRIVSMDDETVYGPRAYTLTFGSAARQGIICNYKIVISVVDGHEVSDFVLKHGITLVEGDLIGARWVANQIAVERAIERTGAVRGITFHSRVSSAKEFSADTTRGIRQWLPDFSVFHVNGTQSSSERKQLIRSFRDAEKALVTNARCLTEGINVPAVDMVAFIDPRHSRIDIAQGTGRAMRKPSGSDKTIGYVVVPIFLERKAGETLEEAFKRSEFGDVANILNAMQEQDEDLVHIIRELQEANGYGEPFNPQRLADKIEVLGPSIELSALKSSIFAAIVHAIGNKWDEMFGRLILFKAREAHCRVPRYYKENGSPRGQWVSYQRRYKDALPEERQQRLNELGFIWNPYDTDWDKGYRYLTIYKEREGHCLVPHHHMESSFHLGRWVGVQRLHRDTISKERCQRLDQLGFVWDVLDSKWEEGLRHLIIYKERKGHCRVHQHHKESDFALGKWVSIQRVSENVLSEERRRRLDTLGFVWDALETNWEEGFKHLTIYREREGHCRVPHGHKKNGFRLGQWVSVQRRNRKNLSEERRQELEKLGFVWDVLETNWEEGYKRLVNYLEREGHCRVPQRYEEQGFHLGLWVSVQRQNRNALSEERRRRLDKLGFVWRVLQTNWEKGYRHLRTYKVREGHCRVPIGHKENGFRLGQWVSVQRKNILTLSEGRRQRLDKLGFVFEPLETAWEKGFRHLIMYKDREGHCRVPQDHEESGFALGRWVRYLRPRKDSISQERQQGLNDLGFVWNVFETDWEQGYGYLTIYKEREGHCRVPQDYTENSFPLGHWLSVQRVNRNRGILSEERRERLDNLGVVWEPHETGWEKGYEYLTVYKEREGHCRVPQRHEERGFRLGRWVGVQRLNRRFLSEDRRQRLAKLGFVWEILSDQWENGFSYLIAYKEREGHCYVPKLHIENTFKLGNWVHNQRTIKDAMPIARRQRLDDLGFVWNGA